MAGAFTAVPGGSEAACANPATLLELASPEVTAAYGRLYSGLSDDSSIEQINGIVRAHLLNNWFTAVDVEHSLSNDETQEATVSLTYQALCWSVSLESNYTPEDTAFMVIFNLANIGGRLGLGN